MGTEKVSANDRFVDVSDEKMPGVLLSAKVKFHLTGAKRMDWGTIGSDEGIFIRYFGIVDRRQDDTNLGAGVYEKVCSC